MTAVVLLFYDHGKPAKVMSGRSVNLTTLTFPGQAFLVNQIRTKGEGWSTANKFKSPPTPRNFIAGRPKEALLFWFFGDFRCSVSLFIVILIKIKIEIGKNRR